MAPLDLNDPAADHIDDQPMPLLEHLIELRQRLLWSCVAFALCFVFCYIYAKPIYQILAAPLAHVQSLKGEQPRLIYTELHEAFVTYLKVAMFGAAFLSFPVVSTQVWKFIAPGLYRSEKRAFLPFLIATPVLFLSGAALAYFAVIPLAWSFFAGFESRGGGANIELLPKVSEYLSLIMKLIMAFGIAFEMPVLFSLCARAGLLTSASLRKYRRYAYVGCFMLAAVLTPPDAISMCSLAVPLIGLYEISILAARLVEPKPVEI